MPNSSTGAMLRVKYVVVVENSVMTIHPGAVPPLRRLELVGEPDPVPVAADTQGRARIVREGTDFMEVDADVASPSILLVTDAWARGRGKHRLRLEYAPLAFHVGAIVSVMAWATWIVAAVLLWRRVRRLARA